MAGIMIQDAGTVSVNPLVQAVRERLSDYAENRKALEEKWQRNYEAYNGISSNYWKRGEAGSSGEEDDDWRSDTFVNVTRQKISAALAIQLDTVLQGGKLPFTLKYDPQMKLTPEEIMILREELDNQKALIDAQMVWSDQEREGYIALEMGDVYGECWGKKYIGTKEVPQFRMLEETGGYGVTTQAITYPGVQALDVWNVYHDMEEQNVADKEGIIHRQFLSLNKLKSWLGKPAGSGFIDMGLRNAIKAVHGQMIGERNSSVESPKISTTSMSPRDRNINRRVNRVEALEWWGRMPARLVDDFEIYAQTGEWPVEDFDEEMAMFEPEVEIMCLVVGDDIVRFRRTRAVDRPFIWYRTIMDVTTYSGRSFADNIEHVQKVLNGAVRAFEDNTRLAGDIMGVMSDEVFNGKDALKIKPGKFSALGDGLTDDVNKAIKQIVIQNVGREYLPVIELFMQFADEESGVPKLAQGLPDSKSNTTAFEIAQRSERASKFMGMTIRNFDDMWIEEVVEWFLEFNDPRLPMAVQAGGFNSFLDRQVKLQAIIALMDRMTADPDYKNDLHVDKMLKAYMRGNDLEEDELVKSPQERQQSVSQAEQAQLQLAMAQIQEITARSSKLQAEAAGKQYEMGKTMAETGKTEAEEQKILAETSRILSGEPMAGAA